MSEIFLAVSIEVHCYLMLGTPKQDDDMMTHVSRCPAAKNSDNDDEACVLLLRMLNLATVSEADAAH